MVNRCKYAKFRSVINERRLKEATSMIKISTKIFLQCSEILLSGDARLNLEKTTTT